MKSLKFLTVALALSIGAASSFAQAINGSIGFTGAFTSNPGGPFTATTVITPTNTITFGAAGGDYAVVPNMTSVSFGSFALNAGSIVPLWSFTSGALSYGFNATSVTNTVVQTNDFLLSGSGVASITGKSNTAGTWVISGNQSGVNLTFSSSAVVVGGGGPGVPDGGSTALMLGLGLLGLGVGARRFRRKVA